MNPATEPLVRPIEAEEARETARIFYAYTNAILPLPVEPVRDAWARCTPRPSCRNCCEVGVRNLNRQLEAAGLAAPDPTEPAAVTEAEVE